MVGITGTGGAGKSSLVDEILIRFLEAFPDKRVAVLCVDPSRRRTGGALLGDRLRVNAAGRSDRVFFRSMATRRAHAAMSATVRDGLRLLRAAGFDLILLETAGIGQSDTEVTEVADLSLYVMTPEYGAPSQLEKIGMLDYADFVVLNKFDRHGAEDALKDVRKAWQRNHKAFGAALESLPVFGTCAHRFQDPGTHALCNALFNGVCARLGWEFAPFPGGPPDRRGLLPRDRVDYLRRIAATVEGYHAKTREQAEAAGRAQHLAIALEELGRKDAAAGPLRARYDCPAGGNGPWRAGGIARASTPCARPTADPVQTYRVRGTDIQVANHSASLSGLDIPKVSLPATASWADRVEFLRSENAPGRFPFTAGVFPFKREGEDPTRMFAGEGTAERTNARFHYVSKGQKAVRLSTAFDSVTLYGADPDPRPDIYGKVGNSGVSVCCLDDAKRLYSGFDLCAPDTSVSMTINGPAPILLAFFFNTAIDAACERWLRKTGAWKRTQARIAKWFKDRRIEAAPLPRRPPAGRPRRIGTGLPGPARRRGDGQGRLRAHPRGNPGPGARHGAGRYPQGGSGPEHLHLLHRILPAPDGGHPGVFHRPRRAQFLQRQHQRLPYRRGGRQSHHPIGPDPGQRLHLCGVLQGAGHGRRRSSRPTCPSSFPMAWIRNTP